jgi:hypothetical protein
VLSTQFSILSLEFALLSPEFSAFGTAPLRFRSSSVAMNSLGDVDASGGNRIRNAFTVVGSATFSTTHLRQLRRDLPRRHPILRVPVQHAFITSTNSGRAIDGTAGC